MQICVLGACRAAAQAGDADAARSLDLGGRKRRSVLSALTLHLGTDVSADLLVGLVWGEGPPGGAHGTLHSYISGLRRVLEPGLAPRERPTVLVTTDHGYRLVVPRKNVDAYQFRDEVRATHRVLAPLVGQLTPAPAVGWPDRETVALAVDRLEDALTWWDGEAFADLGDHPDVVAERAALDQLRLTAEEDRILGLLALGDHATVVATTESATGRHSLRERIWALHALALTRCGRQAEALGALRHYRGVLAEELGLDPSQELRILEQAILTQDPLLRPPAADPASQPSAPVAHASQLPPPRPPAVPRVGDWATVGREAESAALADVLDAVAGGEPAAALLVGEAGIGKSRLVKDMVTAALERGFVVGVGRCSQDDGAPPLWPWRAVLEDLGGDAAQLVTAEADGGFRTWEAVVTEVTRRSAEAPVLVVLEDLHWSDTASLRTLTHLLTMARSGQRVAVVATRRPGPEPTGALAEVGEAFARRHASRLDLTGLTVEEARRLVVGATGVDVTPRIARSWHARSGGNPFFLVELARLGEGDRDDAGSVPATVRDVLTRRLHDVPDETRELLILAAVVGRTFGLHLLALLAGRQDDEVDELLEPARVAGLVVDDTPGVLSFTHALTRDAVAGSARPTRLARLHAQVAHALESDPVVWALLRPEERVAELARHWLAAGPTYVGRAWRAALQAAEQSRRVFSHVEAAELMRAAVEANRRDPAGTPEERHAMLLTRAGDCQRMADWHTVVDCAVEAIALARSVGHPERVAEAAAELTRNSLWIQHDWQVVREDVVEDLRWALAELPTSDSLPRCRTMVALAAELHYAPDASAERRALIDEGLAMARRIGDPALVWWATRAAWIALWVPSLLPERDRLAQESLEAAEQLGDPDLLALSHAVVACCALERGDPHGWRVHAETADRLARRRRLMFVRYVLGFVEVNLAGMRGDLSAAQDSADLLRELRYHVQLPAQHGHEAGIAIAGGFWIPAVLEQFVEQVAAAADADEDGLMLCALYVALARAGQVDEAAMRMRTRPVHLDGEYWGTSMDAALLAELAVHTRDTDLAGRARRGLRPLTGRNAVMGFSVVAGPVDGYLALAEAVLGDRAAAAGYADRALEQASAWDIPLYAAWLMRHRESLGF